MGCSPQSRPPAEAFETVEMHCQTLMQKLGIDDTAGLTRYAMAAGVIESGLQTTFVS